MSISTQLSLQLIRRSFGAWVEDSAASMGAAIAYYTAFSIAPLLLIVITIAGIFFGREAAEGALLTELQGLVGQNGALAVQAILRGAQDPAGGAISLFAGVGTLVLGATSVFAELQNDLDRIWKAHPARSSGLWNFIHTRLLSFGIILGLGFLLAVSLVLSAAVAAMGSIFGSVLGNEEVLLQVINALVSFGITTVLFAMIYKLLPSAKVEWRDVWTGALVTSLLFSIGKFLISLYIGKAAISSSFGAAGAFVVLMVWIYYSAQIFLLGAEFTAQFARIHGSRSIRGRSPSGRGLVRR